MLFRIAFALFIAGACHTPSLMAQDDSASSTVVVEPHGEDYRATFTFASDEAAWAFHRSALRRADRQPWRPDSWRVATPGVSLVRAGTFDALVAEDGTVPRTVAIDFTPAPVDLIADYDPALVLTDGTTAIFSGAFTSFPVASLAELEALAEPGNATSQIVFRARDGMLFHAGQSGESAISDGTTYAIYGDFDIAGDALVARIFDPQLPQWIAESIDSAAPRVAQFYADRIGPFDGARPLIFASWVPSDMQGASQGGSVLPGMITMRFEGQGFRDPDERMLAGTIWFVAHELAHNWLGETIRYDNRDRAWITEGGADLMAWRATQPRDSDIAAMRELAARTECADLLPNGGVETVRRRNEHRAYYACGSLFALAVEQAGAERGEDFFDFVRLLIEHNPDGEVSGEEWLATAGDFGLSQEKAAIIRRLLDEGSGNAAADIESLVGPAPSPVPTTSS